MDEETERLLRLFQHRMANAIQLYERADAFREQANAIDQQLALPIHKRPPENYDLLALETNEGRDRADALVQRADGMQERLQQPPSPGVIRKVQEWRRTCRSSKSGPTISSGDLRFARL